MPGDTFTVGDLRLDVLSPDRCWADTDSDTNNDSLVILLRHGDDSFLMGGEPEEPAQQVLLDERVAAARATAEGAAPRRGDVAPGVLPGGRLPSSR